MKVSTAEGSDDYSTYTMVRRLLIDEALAYWPRYVVAFLLMGVAAAGTAMSAYLLGTMTNEAYVGRNFRGIVVIGLVAIVIFAAKGLATYGATVMLSKIGNRIIANNQRRMFDKLLRQNMGFFADRHSSEFIARLTTGANAVSRVINLLITAHRPRPHVGHRIDDRDGDPGSDDVARRLRRGATGIPGPAQTRAPRSRHRADAIHRRYAHRRDDAGSPARHAHGQGVLARRRNAAAVCRQRRRRRAAIRTRWRASPPAPAR